MNSYVVEVKPPARKELEALPDTVLSRVVCKLEALGHTPRPAGSKKLKGYKDQWRVRVGGLARGVHHRRRGESRERHADRTSP